MTKRELAVRILDDYKSRHKIDKLTDSEVFYSSIVGICMQYLGMLHDQRSIEYINSRGGVINVVESYIPFRSIFEALPEE